MKLLSRISIIQGSIALQAAFLVAFKQLVPEHNVTLLRGLLKARVKHFPAVFLAANTLSGLILGTESALILAWTGFSVSWTYLRFYKPDQDSPGRGDASETFTFASFWPDILQPFISPLTDRLYSFALLLHFIRPFPASDLEARPQTERQPTRREEEAERRRAVALKALDERLKEAKAPKTTSDRLSEEA